MELGFYLIVFALFGLVLGSFGNVVIWRLPRNESLSFPGSHCTVCNHPLKPTDNIPVFSYLFLRGKCRYCHAPISVRYPLIELTSAVLFALAPLYANNLPQAITFAFFFYFLLLLSVIDLDTRRLPNPLVATLAIVGVLGVALSYIPLPDSLIFTHALTSDTARFVLPIALGTSNSPALSAVIGVAASSLPALTIALLYQGVRGKQGFGMGDIKLLAAIGIFLGGYGALVLPVAAILGVLALAIMHFATKKVSIDAQIPFGPFIALASLVILMYGPYAWDAYLHLFS